MTAFGCDFPLVANASALHAQGQRSIGHNNKTTIREATWVPKDFQSESFWLLAA